MTSHLMLIGWQEGDHRICQAHRSDILEHSRKPKGNRANAAHMDTSNNHNVMLPS